MSAAVCSFDSIQGAVDTVIATIQLGVPVARIELLDEVQMDARQPLLEDELSGRADAVLRVPRRQRSGTSPSRRQTVQALAAERGGRGFQWATRLEDRERLWQARHDAHYAALALRPGCRAWTTDVCVPISRLAECIVETKHDHAGRAVPDLPRRPRRRRQLPPDLRARPGEPDELEEARRLNERMVARALAMGGTCTGEHGVGFGKMKFLVAEHGEGVDVMRDIKRALDPDNRMNPGKVVDA